jgi:hypothetical protein
MFGPLRFIRIIAHVLWALEKKRDLLFSELIIFMDKIILVQNYYLSREKYFESSENSEKFSRDIMEHEEPK